MTKQVGLDLKNAIVNLLFEVGEDTTRNGLQETPARFEKQIRECLVGYSQDPAEHIKLFDNTSKFADLVTVSNISFASLCEHHLLPFFGVADIAYVPGEKILGLSKFARIVDVFSKRLQVQEHLTQEIADFLYKELKPGILLVRLQASHSCMTIRGVTRPESSTETLVILGDSGTYEKQIDNFLQRTKRAA